MCPTARSVKNTIDEQMGRCGYFNSGDPEDGLLERETRGQECPRHTNSRSFASLRMTISLRDWTERLEPYDPAANPPTRATVSRRYL
jgi:hypothetical protein